MRCMPKRRDRPTYRFYSLYDKVYRDDVLWHAYGCCQSMAARPASTARRSRTSSATAWKKWLGELAEELRTKNVSSQAGAAGLHPQAGWQTETAGHSDDQRSRSADGGSVGLGADLRGRLAPEQNAYRLGAVRWTRSRRPPTAESGHREVVDADLSGYFDSIPHPELMKSVSRRVSDRHMLRLIKMWLRAPVEEIDKRGRSTSNDPEQGWGRGMPTRGSDLAAVESNLYMRRFILGWKVLGHERRFQARIVNYADDFVICCRGKAEEANGRMRASWKLKLTVNAGKTHVCRVPDESFDFLGIHLGPLLLGRRRDALTLGTSVEEEVARLCREISEMTRGQRSGRGGASGHHQRKLRGWSNYFRLGPVSKAYGAVDYHVVRRLRQWLCRKHKVKGAGTSRFSAEYLYLELGLVRLRWIKRNFP